MVTLICTVKLRYSGRKVLRLGGASQRGCRLRTYKRALDISRVTTDEMRVRLSSSKMLSKRSLLLLSSAERQVLRQQWLGSGQCARCFHASRRRTAEESGPEGSGERTQSAEQGNDQGTPYNSMHSTL